jgi:hypothetical protein
MPTQTCMVPDQAIESRLGERGSGVQDSSPISGDGWLVQHPMGAKVAKVAPHAQVAKERPLITIDSQPLVAQFSPPAYFTWRGATVIRFGCTWPVEY